MSIASGEDCDEPVVHGIDRHWPRPRRAGEKLARDAAVSKTRLIPSPARSAAAPGPPVAGGGAKQSATVASFGQLVVAQIPSEALLAYTTLLALFTAAGSATSYRVGRWLVYVAAIVVCAASVIAGYFAQRDYTFIDASRASAPPVGHGQPVAGGQQPGSNPSATQVRAGGAWPQASSTDVTAPLALGEQFPPGLTAGAGADPGPAPPAAAPRSRTARKAPARSRTASALARLHLPVLPTTAAMLSMAVYGLTVPGSPLQFEVSGTAFAIWSGCLAVTGGVLMSIVAPFLGKGNTAVPTPHGANE
jgi:hypothetical protein